MPICRHQLPERWARGSGAVILTKANIMKIIGLILLAYLAYLAFSDPVNAAPRIAVLNFELHDVTLLPNAPEELTRTASMKLLLEQAISRLGDYEIVQISVNDQNTATAGVGYLFDFNDVVQAYNPNYKSC